MNLERTATDAALEAIRTERLARIRRSVDLSIESRWRIGGRADAIIEPYSIGALIRAVTILRASTCRFTVVGDTTNVLFADEGYRGVLIRISRSMSEVRFEGDGRVTVEAGAWVPTFVRATISQGLGGCVHAIGIPGTVGGLVVMNGGTQRKGISESLVEVSAIAPTGEVVTLSREECAFRYRHSAFQNNGMILLGARLLLVPRNPSELRREALSILADRRRKFPQKEANCGSVFVSDPKLYDRVGPPGRVIESLGLKGYQIGGARISERHANFILNVGSATANDVLRTIAEINRRSLSHYGFMMDCEVMYMSDTGKFIPADQVAISDQMPRENDS